MKYYIRIIWSLAVVITCAAPGFAQGAGPAPPRVSAPDARIQTNYDHVKDTTTVRLIPMQVYGEPLAASTYVGRDEASFSGSFSYSGRTLSDLPARVLFSLVSTSRDWKYTDFRKRVALVDGKSLKLGTLEHVPSFAVTADHVSQDFAISVPYATFLRIANGKSVRLRMGPREFKLGENHLEALRDLARRMIR